MRSFTIVSALLLAACASVPPTPPPPMVALSRTEFPGAAALLDGFSAPEQRNEWRIGERILYGIRLEKGRSQQRWLLRLTLVDNKPGKVSSLTIQSNDEPISLMSPDYTYRVEVFDGDGKPLGDSQVQVPYDFLRYDFTVACEDSRHPPIDKVAMQRIAGAYAALISFLGILQNDALLSDILWQVVDKPSLWSVVTGLGVTVGMATELGKAADVPTPLPAPWHQPAVRFPLVITVNGAHALETEVTATSPLVPMRMGAGIVQIAGHLPSDPNVRFAACVLAATSP